MSTDQMTLDDRFPWEEDEEVAPAPAAGGAAPAASRDALASETTPAASVDAPVQAAPTAASEASPVILKAVR